VKCIGVRARGRAAAPPLSLTKQFFRQLLNFSGSSQQPRIKIYIFWYLLNEKMELIPFSDMHCPKSLSGIAPLGARCPEETRNSTRFS